MKLGDYHQMAGDLAERMLSAAQGGLDASLPIASALPAAKVLLRNAPPTEPDDGAFLASGLQMLASIGREHGRTGVMMRDPAGQARPIYHLLVLHIHLAAFARRYESMNDSIWSVCEEALPQAIEPARVLEDFADAPPSADQVDLLYWRALCVLDQATLLGRDVDIELVDSAVHAALRLQGEDGSLHPRDQEQSLDSWTYRELAGLHALANLALARRNRAWAKRVQEIAEHHLAHTQPDYTTYQPWGLFAFTWSPSTVGFADQQLHDATTWLAGCGDGVAKQAVGSMGAGASSALIPGLLLADAARCFARFESHVQQR